MEKELSVWSQARLILKGMANGECQRLHIPADKIDSVRAMSYRIGKFSFSNAGDGLWDITRREPNAASSRRAMVNATLSKSVMAFFAATTPSEHNNLRNYINQYDKKNGTIHRFAECDGGAWVSRDRAAELCRPLLASLNNPDSTAEAIGAALAVFAEYCAAVQAQRAKK